MTIVNVLLRYGAPLDAQDAAGMTALHSAVIHDRSNVASRLVRFSSFTVAALALSTCL